MYICIYIYIHIYVYIHKYIHIYILSTYQNKTTWTTFISTLSAYSQLHQHSCISILASAYLHQHTLTCTTCISILSVSRSLAVSSPPTFSFFLFFLFFLSCARRAQRFSGPNTPAALSSSSGGWKLCGARDMGRLKGHARMRVYIHIYTYIRIYIHTYIHRCTEMYI